MVNTDMAAVKNPTELLWAYTLKREHKRLFTRIASVELAAADQESRIKAAEATSASTRGTDIADIAKQVKSLQHGYDKQARKLEDNVAEALDDVRATSEAICLKVASVEKEAAAAKEAERKKAFQSEKALLKRVDELEIGLQAKGSEIAGLKEQVEEGGTGDLKDVVEGLEVVVEQQGDEIKLWRERLAEAERKLVDQQRLLEVCKQEAKNAAEGAVQAAAQAAAQAAREHVRAAIAESAAGTTAVALTKFGPATASNETRLAPLNAASANAVATTSDRPTIMPDNGTFSLEPIASKKTNASHKTKMTKELASLVAGSSAVSFNQARPVVRRGLGWLEVERTPSAEMLPPALKRGPGRPRNADTQAAQALEPAKAQSQAKGRNQKRKAAEEPAAESQPTYTQRTTRSQMPKKQPSAPNSAVAKTVAARRQPKVPASKPIAATKKKQTPAANKAQSQAASKRRRASTPEIPESPSALSELSTILSSPLMSSPSPAQPKRKKQKQAPVVQVEASLSSSPRPRRTGRRRIEQDDDHETFLRKVREGIVKQATGVRVPLE